LLAEAVLFDDGLIIFSAACRGRARAEKYLELFKHDGATGVGPSIAEAKAESSQAMEFGGRQILQKGIVLHGCSRFSPANLPAKQYRSIFCEKQQEIAD